MKVFRQATAAEPRSPQFEVYGRGADDDILILPIQIVTMDLINSVESINTTRPDGSLIGVGIVDGIGTQIGVIESYSFSPVASINPTVTVRLTGNAPGFPSGKSTGVAAPRVGDRVFAETIDGNDTDPIGGLKGTIAIENPGDPIMTDENIDDSRIISAYKVKFDVPISNDWYGARVVHNRTGLLLGILMESNGPNSSPATKALVYPAGLV